MLLLTLGERESLLGALGVVLRVLGGWILRKAELGVILLPSFVLIEIFFGVVVVGGGGFDLDDGVIVLCKETKSATSALVHENVSVKEDEIDLTSLTPTHLLLDLTSSSILPRFAIRRLVRLEVIRIVVSRERSERVGDLEVCFEFSFPYKTPRPRRILSAGAPREGKRRRPRLTVLRSLLLPILLLSSPLPFPFRLPLALAPLLHL